jgi:hypothetical protein
VKVKGAEMTECVIAAACGGKLELIRSLNNMASCPRHTLAILPEGSVIQPPYKVALYSHRKGYATPVSGSAGDAGRAWMLLPFSLSLAVHGETGYEWLRGGGPPLEAARYWYLWPAVI